jgi:phage terminase large subunit GpA-like protein
MREFAEQEIVLPTGPHQGRRFKVERNPFAGLLFDAFDAGIWNRFFTTGPRQSGKTLNGSVIPILYHLFEYKETVIFGLPSLDMAADKWQQDILPVIEASRYRDQLPLSGAGSKGGKVESIQFRNGATLKFMSGGGNDKKRAGFTSRVVVFTEVDGMDESGGSSREADKLTQIEGCTNAFGNRARIYGECTVSIESGRTWQEFTNGTASAVVIECPHCKKYVTPERCNLLGWREAETEIEAGKNASIVCPECGVKWSEQDRHDANRNCKLLHRGQTISGSEITGELPATQTLGFRWSAANNLLVPLSRIAEREWKASRTVDEQNAEKEMCQFVWAMPYKSPEFEITAGNAIELTKRMNGIPRGIVPDDAEFITVGIDIGMRLCHWTAIAWRPNASPHILEYGRLEVPTDQFGLETALLTALRTFRDEADKNGWQGQGKQMIPTVRCVDAGWQDEIVSKFCEESGQGWFPTKGFGVSRMENYRGGEKKQTGARVTFTGEGYHGAALPGWRVPLIEVQSDYWKTWLHLRLQTPMNQAGSLTLHQAEKMDHLSFAKHLTAEKKVEEFVAGKGLVTRWEMLNRNNHYLDSTALACVAGHMAGARLMEKTQTRQAPEQPASQPSENWITGYRGRY